MELREIVLYALTYFEVLASKTETNLDDGAVYVIKEIVKSEELFNALLTLIGISGQANRAEALSSNAQLAGLREVADKHEGQGSIKAILQFVSLVRSLIQVFS